MVYVADTAMKSTWCSHLGLLNIIYLVVQSLWHHGQFTAEFLTGKAPLLVWHPSCSPSPFQTSGRTCPKGAVRLLKASHINTGGMFCMRGVYFKYLSQDKSWSLTSKESRACMTPDPLAPLILHNDSLRSVL